MKVNIIEEMIKRLRIMDHDCLVDMFLELDIATLHKIGLAAYELIENWEGEEEQEEIEEEPEWVDWKRIDDLQRLIKVEDENEKKITKMVGLSR